MFKKCIEKMLLVCVVAVAVMFCIPKNAYADSNPIVGHWAFSAFSYDHRSFSSAAPVAWNRGVVTLNADMTLSSKIVESTSTSYPKDTLYGTYTITSDGQLNACIPTDQNFPKAVCVQNSDGTNNGTMISGRLNKTNDAIVASMMINPQQPAMVTMVRQAPLNVVNTLLGQWTGQVLVSDNQGIHEANLIINYYLGSCDITFKDSTGSTGKLTGWYQFFPYDSDRQGEIRMFMTKSDSNDPNQNITVSGQISASGDMASLVYQSNNLPQTILGMGNIIKLQTPIAQKTPIITTTKSVVATPLES